MHYLLTALLLLPVLVSAQELHTFRNGEVADADKVNENFQTLNSRIQSIDGSGGRPTISISTDSAVTQRDHPFVANITDDTPLYRVGVSVVRDGYDNEIFSRTLHTTPTSYDIEDRTLRATLGQAYGLVVYAQNIDGKASVETVTVGSTLAIPLGDYTVDPPLVVPDRADDVPLNCWHGETISAFPVSADFISRDNPCSGDFWSYSSLPAPVPLVDATDAVGCVSQAPIFSVDDLQTYTVNLAGTGSGASSGGRHETWHEVVTVYTPGNPAALSRLVTEWCQYLPTGESSPEGVQTFSRTYQFTATKSD